VLSDADDFEEIAEYGKVNEDFLQDFIALSGGIPFHDTLRRIFSKYGYYHKKTMNVFKQTVLVAIGVLKIICTGN